MTVLYMSLQIGSLKARVSFLFSSNWIIISCYFLNVAVTTHCSTLQLNLHYPDLAYLDFLIIDFGLASLVPVFHEYWCSSHILCSQQNFLASNYVRKLHCLQTEFVPPPKHKSEGILCSLVSSDWLRFAWFLSEISPFMSSVWFEEHKLVIETNASPPLNVKQSILSIKDKQSISLCTIQ